MYQVERVGLPGPGARAVVNLEREVGGQPCRLGRGEVGARDFGFGERVGEGSVPRSVGRSWHEEAGLVWGPLLVVGVYIAHIPGPSVSFGVFRATWWTGREIAYLSLCRRRAHAWRRVPMGRAEVCCRAGSSGSDG